MGYAAMPYQLPGVDSCAVADVTEEVAEFLARLLGHLEPRLGQDVEMCCVGSGLLALLLGKVQRGSTDFRTMNRSEKLQDASRDLGFVVWKSGQ